PDRPSAAGRTAAGERPATGWTRGPRATSVGRAGNAAGRTVPGRTGRLKTRPSASSIRVKYPAPSRATFIGSSFRSDSASVWPAAAGAASTTTSTRISTSTGTYKDQPGGAGQRTPTLVTAVTPWPGAENVSGTTGHAGSRSRGSSRAASADSRAPAGANERAASSACACASERILAWSSSWAALASKAANAAAARAASRRFVPLFIRNRSQKTIIRDPESNKRASPFLRANATQPSGRRGRIHECRRGTVSGHGRPRPSGMDAHSVSRDDTHGCAPAADELSLALQLSRAAPITSP